MNRRFLVISFLILIFSFKFSMMIENKNIYSDDENWKYSTVYLIPSTHADPYWKGEWAGPNMGTFHDNLLEALLYLKINPDFRYTIDQASIALTFMEEYPEYRDDLIKAIKEGKIEIVGGGVSQADLNIPTGEGLIRNFLEGKKIIKQYFNVDIKVAWQVDTFGAPGSFPSILSSMDYKYLYYMRDSRGRPEGAFWWESLDGSKILCWKTRYGRYPLTAPDLIAMINYEINRPMAKQLPSGDIMLHIGGDKIRPLINLMDYIETWNAFYAEKSKYRVKVATPSEFFEKIENEANTLPHYGFGQDHNPYNEGAQLSYIETKVYSRLWETSAIMAEFFGTLGRNILNRTRIYELNELHQGWWQNCFFYHHDTLTGTSPYSIVSNFLEDYRIQAQRADFVLEKTLSAFAKEIGINSSTEFEESDGFLVVFNSESYNRSQIITANVPFNPNIFPEYNFGSFNWSKIGINMKNLWNKQEVPAEIISFDSISDEDLPNYLKNATICFKADIPPAGYSTFAYNFTYDEENLVDSIAPIKVKLLNNSKLISVDNGVYNITWNMQKGGNIVSLLKKGIQVIPQGSSIGISYIDTTNDPYHLDMLEELDNSANYNATYNLFISALKANLEINIPMYLYNLTLNYEICLNSTSIPISLQYKFLEDQKPQESLANILMMNFGWNDDTSTWINGQPYGWTDHTSDKDSQKEFPATFWSIIENSSLGLAIYDKGIPPRHWSPTQNRFSILLLHQNDPYDKNSPTYEKLSKDPRALYERSEFYYDEIESFRLDFAFEYYEPNWSSAEIPMKARSFNYPLYVIGLNSSAIMELSESFSEIKIGKTNFVQGFSSSQSSFLEYNQLPEWGSFFESNSSNVILVALKKGDFENGIILRIFVYPYNSINASKVKISMLNNLKDISKSAGCVFDELTLVSSLEMPFENKSNNADPSIQTIPQSILSKEENNVVNFNISTEILKEHKIRTFLISQSNIDVKSPQIDWKFPLFGVFGFPLEIKFYVNDSSNIRFYGEYSEDAGQTWKEIKKYSIEKAFMERDGEYLIKAVIYPNLKCKLRVRIIISDAFNNTNSLGYFETTFVHKNTDYGDKSFLFPNAPQIRIIWPISLIIIVLFSIVCLVCIISKSKDNREKSQLDSSSSIKNIQPFENIVIKIKVFFATKSPLVKYSTIGFLALFALSFLQQSLFVYDYTDYSDVIFLDEYILDHIQFFRRNMFYIPIYLSFVFITLLLISIFSYKKHQIQAPMYLGFIFLPIPLLSNIFQMSLYLLYGKLNTLSAKFVWNEILHLYINPMVALAHIITIFGGIYLPRLFILNKNSIKEKREMKIERKLQFIRKLAKITYLVFAYGIQLICLSYFSMLIFVDFHTRFLGGTALGEISRSQSYVIWCYYAFLIIFFVVYSALASLIFEIIPTKFKVAKKPWSLKLRYLLILIGQIIGVVVGWLYYIYYVQNLEGIIQMEPELYFLYVPAMLFSQNTWFLLINFVAIPNLILFLIFYPIKSLIRLIIKQIELKFINKVATNRKN
ncbi:MAG: hypothetical protein ACTSRZ_09705 [Promethearchaeota archaeon]